MAALNPSALAVVFPAYAGVSPNNEGDSMSIISLPRLRGGEPV